MKENFRKWKISLEEYRNQIKEIYSNSEVLFSILLANEIYLEKKKI